MVAVAVSLDALTDPLIGFLSDSCRWTYKGAPMRRRPFIMVGSCCLVFVYLLLWAPCVSLRLPPSLSVSLSLCVSVSVSTQHTLQVRLHG